MASSRDDGFERGSLAMLREAEIKFQELSTPEMKKRWPQINFTGVRWGKSERTFAVVLPAKGAPAWVLPGFEEMRARELIRPGDDIRVWQEDESPYQRIVQALKDRGIATGRVGIDDGARFFVFDGIRKLAPAMDYVSAMAALKAAGFDPTQAGRGRGARK